MKIIKILAILVISFTTLLGCKDDENQDSTPPGSLTIENITPTNGGGIISYQLPRSLECKIIVSLGIIILL